MRQAAAFEKAYALFAYSYYGYGYFSVRSRVSESF